jgi:predicted kinase
MSKPAIIVDIDGTVADLSHRLHHINGNHKNWDAFFSKVNADTPIWGTIETITDMLANNYDRDEPYTLIFVSGRPEKTRLATKLWLDAYFDMDNTQLLMRPDNDTRQDYIVKEEILDNIIGQGYDIKMVFDDRPSVIEMWKRRGLHVFQVHAAGAAPVHDEAKAALFLLVGPTHAGKTTYVQAGPFHDCVHLESDRIRQQLTGDPTDQTHNDEVFALMHTLVRTYLQAGVDVVYDATNIRRKDRIAAASLAAGGPVVYHVFDRPLDVKLAQRRENFPEAVIIKHDQTFKSQLKDILSGDSLPNVTVEDHR